MFEKAMNAVTCLNCGDYIVSKYCHDFVSCSCPEEKRISVDGGAAYRKRCFGRDAKWREEDGSVGGSKMLGREMRRR